MLSSKQPKKLIKTPKDIEKLIKMMKEYIVDSLEVEGVKIAISRFPVKQEKIKEKTAEEIKREEEALLFLSAH